MDVTGLVVSYNEKALLERCLSSIRKFYPDMLIIIEDGSPANSECRKYIEGLEGNYSKHLHNWNIGHGRGLHHGIQLSPTNHILCFETDITMEKPCIEEMMALMDKDTWGVGLCIPYPQSLYQIELDRKGDLTYMRPQFHIINRDVYNQFEPYVHAAAPGQIVFIDLFIKEQEWRLKHFPTDDYTTHHKGGTSYRKDKAGHDTNWLLQDVYYWKKGLNKKRPLTMIDSDITVVMIDSRSHINEQMVQTAIHSVKKQYYPVKFVVIDNRNLAHTIGACWNEAIRQSESEWILLMGDDDWLSRDYCYCLHKFAQEQPGYDMISTGMTFYNPNGTQFETPQQNTGMWKREYLLKYPFNEKLQKGVDREYIEEASKRGCNVAHLNYHHGIFVRVHDDKDPHLTKRPNLIEEPGEYYFNSRYSSFIAPVVNHLKYQGYSVTFDNHDFDGRMAKNAKLIWCDWADENAYNIANFQTTARKILRLHAYEAFTTNLFYINFDAFEKIIFVAPHIKRYVEKRLKRKLTNAIVIPNGVNLNKYTVIYNKKENNKIAWAGNIDRKKGAQLLMFIAEHFPLYDFHVAGKFYEEDIAEYFNKNKPSNLYIEPYSYDLNDFFKDKTYFLNTSPREGCPLTPLEAMACGLKPIIYNWVGAREYLPSYWVFKDISEMETILNGEYDPFRYRDYVENNYSFNIMYDKFKEIIDNGIDSSSTIHEVQDAFAG